MADSPLASVRPRRCLENWVAGFILTAAGQLILVALGPLSRAAQSQGGSAGPWGIALLSSDSFYYLSASDSASLLPNVPINRVALPIILQFGSVLGSAEVFGVLVNALAFIVAGAALYDLGRRLGKSRLSGGLCAAAVLVNPLTAQWVRFVLTEALMYALVVLLVWGVERYSRQGAISGSVVAITATTSAALLRPNGALLVASAVTLLMLLRTTDNANRFKPLRTTLLVLMWPTTVAVMLITSNASEGNEHEVSNVIINLLYDGVVVEGSPDVIVRTTMPPPDSPRDASMAAALRYVIQHPVDVMRLAVLRVGYETFQLRPHYPRAINILLGIGFSFFLLFASVGAWQTQAHTIRLATIVITAPQLMLVASTFAVPESRYAWTYLVPLAVWVGTGAEHVVMRLFARDLMTP